VGGFGAILVSAFSGNAALPESLDLPGGARLVKDGMVAAFVLPAGHGALALVDCGDDTEGKKLLAELARRNAKPEDVAAIFLTHGHGDHTGGCHLFPKAEVMALSADVGLAAGVASSRGPLTGWRKNAPEKSVKVARELKDGETVQVGELSVKVFAVPGHTDGSAAFLAGGVLFLGDSATCREDGTFAGAPWAFSNSREQNHASLRGLFQRLKDDKSEVQALAPAHSAPQTGLKAFEAFTNSKD
jgi:glyoxylase-like metal-dependent hydrolase (beta-lactamase superfamily II)